MNPVLRKLVEQIEQHVGTLRSLPVSTAVGRRALRGYLEARFDFTRARPASEVVADVSRMLRQWSLHGGHPRYYGLSAQGVDLTSVAASTLTALFDPQLAAWETSPAAVEAERHLLAILAARLGLPADTTASFTAGASEATWMALVVALTRAVPAYAARGLAGTGAWPTVYVSAQGHPSIYKLSHTVGLGRSAVRVVACDNDLRMDASALALAISRDRERGERPTVVVATAGTTEAGAIDPLGPIADLCAAEGLWLHVDAAWGGSAVLAPSLAPALAGIGRADSVAWDAHKGLGVPLGAGMFFCRHPNTVLAAFTVDAPYMPRVVPSRVQPFAMGLQWSRRFAGLPLFMTMAEKGIDGVGDRIARQSALADRLRIGLRAGGWQVVNQTVLPVVCFTHPAIASGQVRPREVVQRLRRTGTGWIAETALRPGEPCLRACIASHATGDDDIDALVQGLDDALRTQTARTPEH